MRDIFEGIDAEYLSQSQARARARTKATVESKTKVEQLRCVADLLGATAEAMCYHIFRGNRFGRYVGSLLGHTVSKLAGMKVIQHSRRQGQTQAPSAEHGSPQYHLRRTDLIQCGTSCMMHTRTLDNVAIIIAHWVRAPQFLCLTLA